MFWERQRAAKVIRLHAGRRARERDPTQGMKWCWGTEPVALENGESIQRDTVSVPWLAWVYSVP